MTSRSTACAAIAACVVAAALIAFLRPIPRTAGVLPHDVYVWQRAWGAPVQAAVTEHAGRFDTVLALAAEVAFDDSGSPRVVRPAGSLPTLAATQRRVGFALRVGSWSGSFDADHEVTHLLAELSAELVAEARAAGVRPAELQLDFDAAESQLDGYRTWVAAVRAAVRPVPVTITALPSWLDRRSFSRLARETDGYVLQVHSVERPVAGVPAPLCDTDRARSWVEHAARIGVPFRVALPTYGYLMAFDADDTPLGLSAEGPRRDWPATARVVDVRADATELGPLVASWTQDRPACLRGVVWYRLPVAGDTLNWRWETLDLVMRGGRPRAHVQVAAQPSDAGRLVELRLENDGAADGRSEAAFAIRWDHARLIAADALRGFEILSAEANTLQVRSLPQIATERLAPGESRAVAWLRFDAETEVHIDALDQ